MNEISLKLFQPYVITPMTYEFDGEDYFGALEEAMWHYFKAVPVSTAWRTQLEKDYETYFEQDGVEGYIKVELSAPDFYYINYPDFDEEED